MFVLVSTNWVMMCPVTGNPTICKIHCYLLFLCQKLECYRNPPWICPVYRQNATSEETIRYGAECLKMARRTNVQDEQTGLQSLVSDSLVQSEISEVRCEFPQISRTILCNTITVTLGCHKFFTKWIPKMLTGAHKMQIMASALTF